MDKSERTLENLQKIARALSLDDLTEANRYVYALIKTKRQDRDRRAVIAFKVGDRVSFKGKRHQVWEGVIEKINIATILVRTTENGKWRVHAGALTLIDRKARKKALSKSSSHRSDVAEQQRIAAKRKRGWKPEWETPPWLA